MSERLQQLSDDAITQFLRTRSADPEPGLLDDIVRTVVATPQERRWFGARPIHLPSRTLLIVASALLIATMGAIAVGSRVLQPDPLVVTFGGTWISTSDADGGTQTMDVRVSDGGAVDITVHDTIASVCSGTPSTMTGSGVIEEGTRFVVPTPVYTCDDDSRPQSLSGPPLEEQLRNWTMTFDAEAGTLTDSVGGIWHREGAEVPTPDPVPTVSDQMWPQRTLEEVREAQELADAGHPDYTWQVDPELDGDAAPWGAQIFARFIEEELGWKAFAGGWDGSGYLSMGPGGGLYQGVVFIRCAPGQTNPLSPLYADIPLEIRGCAPTIDEFTYETVSIDVSQPSRRGPEGLWVVDGWELRESESSEPHSLWDHLYPEFDGRVTQVIPPSDAEVSALLDAFLRARAEGEGAEQYLLREPDASSVEDTEVPLLYATTTGAAYEQYGMELSHGPVWPTGWREFKVRLVATDETVVEQYFHVVRNDERLGLVYGHASDGVPTTENGEPVPVLYRLLDGQVAFMAAPPWSGVIEEHTHASLSRGEIGSASQFTMFTVVADPGTANGCEIGTPAVDAEALLLSVRSAADLEVTDPVATSVGGLDAMQVDVVGLREVREGECVPPVVERLVISRDVRMRLYLLDLPAGLSARTMVIAIVAHDSLFEHVVEAAAPVLGSFEFHAP